MLTAIAGVLLWLPGLLPAQEAPGSFDLVQLERRFEAAVSSCEAAVLARRVDQPTYETAVSQVMAAERSGDEAAQQAAYANFYETSQVIDERQRRVVEQCGRAEEVRRDYLGSLDSHRRGLEEQLAEAGSPARESRIRALLADIDNRYQELEDEQGGIEVQLVMRPIIQISQTDTPDAVEQKAAYLLRLIEMADSLIVGLDEDIERLESRIRRRRGVENFETGVGRFDQLRTPVGSGAGEDDSRSPTANDSTDIGSLPLESRLSAIRDAKLQVEHYRDQMKARVSEFREYLERIT